jgi:hypothetical protein
MKILFILIPIIFSGNVFSGTEFLTKKELSQALTLIDNTCGNIWCEGSFNFDFLSINCSLEKQNCTVEMDLLTYDYTDDEETEVIALTGECTLNNINSYNDIFKIDLFIHKYYLVDSFVVELSDCITDLETKARLL